jgi:hypothetical protein
MDLTTTRAASLVASRRHWQGQTSEFGGTMMHNFKRPWLSVCDSRSCLISSRALIPKIMRRGGGIGRAAPPSQCGQAICRTNEKGPCSCRGNCLLLFVSKANVFVARPSIAQGKGHTTSYRTHHSPLLATPITSDQLLTRHLGSMSKVRHFSRILSYPSLL